MKQGLSNEKREKTVIYIEDLVGVLQTNLTTTKKRHTHGRHRAQLALFHHLAGFYPGAWRLTASLWHSRAISSGS